jgi:hypothetical protein
VPDITINTEPAEIRITLNSEGTPLTVELKEGALIVQKEGVRVGSFNAINLIEGDNVTIDVQKNGVVADITINSQGGGGSGTVESVTGDGVDNTDPANPVLSFPAPTEIGLGNVDNTSDENKPISSATQTALDNLEEQLVELKEEIITYAFNNQIDNYTLALSDFETPTFIRVDKAGTADIEIPSNASIPIPIGRAVIIKKTGTGGLTFTGAGGVTLVASSGSNTSELNQQVVLLKEDTNTWGLYNGVAIDVDALGVVPNTRQVAGIALSADITAAALNYALGQLITSLVPADTNVTNNTTSFVDATGYSFTVEANEKYEFEMYIPYQSSASTNGSEWSINGPGTPTYLQFDCEFNTSSVGRRFSLSLNAFNQTAGPSATSDITNGSDNICKIRGYIQTDTAGTVIARFASEVATTESISVKRNGFGMVKYRKIS